LDQDYRFVDRGRRGFIHGRYSVLAMQHQYRDDNGIEGGLRRVGFHLRMDLLDIVHSVLPKRLQQEQPDHVSRRQGALKR